MLRNGKTERNKVIQKEIISTYQREKRIDDGNAISSTSRETVTIVKGQCPDKSMHETSQLNPIAINGATIM